MCMNFAVLLASTAGHFGSLSFDARLGSQFDYPKTAPLRKSSSVLKKESTHGSRVPKDSSISAKPVSDAEHYVAKWDSAGLQAAS